MKKIIIYFISIALPAFGAIEKSDLVRINPNSYLHKQSMGDVSLYHNKGGFILNRSGSTKLLHNYQLDATLRNMNLHKLQAFLDVGYIHIKELSDGEIHLEARARGLGGGIGVAATAAAAFAVDKAVDIIAESIKDTAKDRKIEGAANWADGVLQQRFPAPQIPTPMDSTEEYNRKLEAGRAARGEARSIHIPRASGFTQDEDTIHATYPGTKGMTGSEAKQKYMEEAARMSSNKQQADTLRAQAQMERDEQAQAARDSAARHAREEQARYDSAAAVKSRTDAMVAKAAIQALDKGRVSIPKEAVKMEDNRKSPVITMTPSARPASISPESAKAMVAALSTSVAPSVAVDSIPTLKSTPAYPTSEPLKRNVFQYADDDSSSSSSSSSYSTNDEPITLIGPARIEYLDLTNVYPSKEKMQEPSRQYFLKSASPFSTSPFQSYNPSATWASGNSHIPAVFGPQVPDAPHPGQLTTRQEVELAAALAIKSYQKYDQANTMVTSILPIEMMKENFGKPIVNMIPQDAVDLAAAQLMAGVPKLQAFANTVLATALNRLCSNLRW